MRIIKSKISLFSRHQSGMSIVEVLVGILATGILAFGGTMATVQILQQARTSIVSGENVRGVAQLARQTMQQTAPSTRPGSLSSPQLRKYAIIARKGDLVLGSHSVVLSTPVDGQAGLYASSEIELKSYANVHGVGVVASGHSPDPIVLRSNAVLSGGEFYNSTEIFENVDADKVMIEAKKGLNVGAQTWSSGTHNGPLYINGDLTIGGTDTVVNLAGGPIYVTGDLSIEGSSNTRIEGTGSDSIGIILAEGKIDVKGNLTWQPADVNQLPLIVSTSNKNNAISLNSNSTISAMLFAMNGDVKITGNSSVYGNIIGNNVKANSGNEQSSITYPTGLATP